MKLDKLEQLRDWIDDEIVLRKAGINPSYKKPRKSVQLGFRDWRVLRHLKTLRAATTRQIARLEYPRGAAPKKEDAEPFSIAYAEQRLYQLARAGYVNSVPGVLEPVPGLAGTNTAWEITRKSFGSLRSPGSEDKYPDPLRGDGLKHLVSVNEVYVLIHELLREIPDYDDDLSCWHWTGEPGCHRLYGGTPTNPASMRFGRWRGSKLKPDAEIVLFDEIVLLLERQTARAREKPEKIHDKVFDYHRYENSLERRSDQRKTYLLWACDAKRDRMAARQARVEHPTRTLRQLGIEEYDTKRMPVSVKTPLSAAQGISETVAKYLSHEASQRIARGESGKRHRSPAPHPNRSS